MFSEELKRIFKLVKKTGDKVVVYDSREPADSFVVMDISTYENMLDNKVQNEGLKKVEKEESVVVRNDLVIGEKGKKPEVREVKKKEIKGGLTEEDLTDRINREISLWKSQEDESFFVEDDKTERFTKPWSIPSEVKQKAKEVE